MQIVEQSGMILISGGTCEWLEIWEIDDIGILSLTSGVGFEVQTIVPVMLPLLH